jgi:hypothetical protein
MSYFQYADLWKNLCVFNDVSSMEILVPILC